MAARIFRVFAPQGDTLEVGSRTTHIGVRRQSVMFFHFITGRTALLLYCFFSRADFSVFRPAGSSRIPPILALIVAKIFSQKLI